MQHEERKNIQHKIQHTVAQLGGPILLLVKQIRAPAGNPTGRHISFLDITAVPQA